MIKRHVLRQLFIFGIVGVVATATHYIIALLCHEALGVNIYVANLFGYSSAVAVSFFGHGRFTFKVDLNHAIFRRFIFVSVSTFVTSELILVGLETKAQLPHRWSLAIVVLTIPLITFLLNKFWVYRHPVASK